MRLWAAAIVLISGLLGLVPSEGGAAVPGKPFTETGCEQHSDSVARLYTAGLGREPEQGGFEFWMTEYTAGRYDLPSMAAFFAASPEFSSSYGELSRDGFVRQLYRNVLGREGETGGVDFWTTQMALGMDRGTVLLRFAESPENITNSGTVQPALGPFNAGQTGPWTCSGLPELSDLEWLQTYNAETRELLDFVSELIDELDGGATLSECAALEADFVDRFGPSGSNYVAKLRRAGPELEDAAGRVFEYTLGTVFACSRGLQETTQRSVDLLTVALNDLSAIISAAANPNAPIDQPDPDDAPAPAGPTASQQQAIDKAEDYLRFSSFSRSGLIGQLEFEEFSTADATFAVDFLDIDFNAQAVKKAASYLDFSSFSRLGLIDQLEFEGFTTAQATHGTDAQGTDYNRQAELKAASYLEFGSFSCQGLIDQLEFEQFTRSEAVHGANSTSACR